MMVISAIMLISMIVVEFVFSSNVNYRMAINQKEQLQAYYLAESALNLMKMELRVDKQIRSAIASMPVAQNLAIDLSQPLCKQFPLSTTLIRNFFVAGQMPLFQGEGEEAAEGGEEKAKEAGAELNSATMFETEKAKDLLSFEGDFDGSCMDEQGKVNLNYFASLDPSQPNLSGINAYDSYKMFLISFFKNERFKKLFADPDKIGEMVRNIADWTDKNDVINDLGNMTHGPESSIYSGENTVQPRNSKFVTPDEPHLVEGVSDTWFLPLQDMFTVYGDGRINICIAEDDVAWTMILTYAGQNPNVPPIDPKNEDLKKQLLDVIRLDCYGTDVQVSKIASDLDIALGITGQSVAGGGFANFLTADSRFYSLKLTGQVGNTMVNIKTVLDVKDPDPKKWRVVYYKVY